MSVDYKVILGFAGRETAPIDGIFQWLSDHGHTPLDFQSVHHGLMHGWFQNLNVPEFVKCVRAQKWWNDDYLLLLISANDEPYLQYIGAPDAYYKAVSVENKAIEYMESKS